MRIARLALLALFLPSAVAAQGLTAADVWQAGKPAKELFGKMKEGAPMVARSFGFYSKGCLAGAVALPIDGPTWQAMRLSRNRNWGHPELIAMLERLANKVPQIAG
ncbi:MAG: penicillin-insensitive murein endopeptidase, partial [Hyphomicrobium sp.]|nr:penicillin-insensitive murein endopeptidase [Hyphomicrobium sp.]